MREKCDLPILAVLRLSGVRNLKTSFQMRSLVVCHCLCLLCMALLSQGKEHMANDSTEHHDHDHHDHDHDHHLKEVVDHDDHEGHDHSSHEHDTHADRAHHPAHVKLEDGDTVDYR